MSDLDLHRFLRELSDLGPRVEADAARIERAPGEAALEDPFARSRWLSSRQTLLELVARKDDPAAPRLAAHVAKLVAGRVNRDAVLAASVARHAPSVKVHATGEVLSIRAALDRLVAARPDGALVARALSEGADAAHHAARVALARAGEIEQRLEVDVAVSPLPRDAAAGLGREVFALLSDHEARDVPLATWVAKAGGHGVDVGLPKDLSARRLAELLAPAWLDGPPLDDVVAPPARAPASYMLGFARLGLAWARSARSRSLPWPLAVTPHGLEHATIGALFAGLFGEPTFVRRALGLGRAEAARAVRQAAEVRLHHARKTALAACLLAPLAADRPRDAVSSWEELATRTFGSAPSPSLVGVLPRVPLDAPTSLAALGLAATLRQELRERFDEDFHANPRTVEHLRHVLAHAPPPSADVDAVRRGLELHARSLLETLS